MAEHLGLDQTLDIAELVYNDPDRAEPAAWLKRAGWHAEAHPATEEMRRLDRWLDIPGADGGADSADAFSHFRGGRTTLSGLRRLIGQPDGWLGCRQAELFGAARKDA